MDKKDFIKQRLKERTASKRYKLSEGENTFRVLPNKLGAGELEFFEYGMHSNVGPANRYLKCGLDQRGKGKCWLCNKIAELAQSKKASHRAAAEKMARTDKFATQIAPISDGTWLPPTLFEMPNGIANALLGVLGRKAIADLKKGYNLTVERVGTTFKSTKYGSLIVDDEPSKVPSKIVEAMKTFEELVSKYDPAKQKEAYYGNEQLEEDDDDDDDDVKVAADDDEDEPKPRKKPAEEEEEDEEDSEYESLTAEADEPEDEPEEDEEEEKPKKKKKPAEDEEEEEEPEEEEAEEEDDPEEDEDDEPKPKKKKKPVEEHEEEEESEEEEEEEEKPKKKSAKKLKKSSHDDDDE